VAALAFLLARALEKKLKAAKVPMSSAQALEASVYGVTRVDLIENIVRHYLPPAGRVYPPKRPKEVAQMRSGHLAE
jgi:hypothetical protein